MGGSEDSQTGLFGAGIIVLTIKQTNKRLQRST
jgi:hypothetical protein